MKRPITPTLHFKNKESIQEQKKEHYQNNKEVITEKAKEYYEKNNAVILEKKESTIKIYQEVRIYYCGFGDTIFRKFSVQKKQEEQEEESFKTEKL